MTAVAELLPGFEEHSRLGVVIREDFGAVGASGLLFAALIGFYDVQRAEHPEGFYRYADFYLFQVGCMRGNHNMLEIVPDHKEVLVADDPEEILRAINDRGVTHLAVPDGVPGEPEFERQTDGSALARIRSALLYSASGRVARADVEIKGHGLVDSSVADTLEPIRWADDVEAAGAGAEVVAWARSRAVEVEPEAAARTLSERDSLRVDGRIVESYRRVGVEEALGLLVPAGPSAAAGA